MSSSSNETFLKFWPGKQLNDLCISILFLPAVVFFIFWLGFSIIFEVCYMSKSMSQFIIGASISASSQYSSSSNYSLVFWLWISTPSRYISSTYLASSLRALHPYSFNLYFENQYSLLLQHWQHIASLNCGQPVWVLLNWTIESTTWSSPSILMVNLSLTSKSVSGFICESGTAGACWIELPKLRVKFYWFLR